MSNKKIFKKDLPTEEQVDQYELLEGFLDSIINEIREFSKKNPNEVLNQYKVNMVNRVLSQIKDILKQEPTAQFLELLDEETLPSYSDSVLTIGQYKAAMIHYKEKYYGFDDNEEEDRWFTKNNPY